MACNTCRAIFEILGTGATPRKLKHSQEGIEFGSREGCIFCMNFSQHNLVSPELEVLFQTVDSALLPSPLADGNLHLGVILSDRGIDSIYNHTFTLLRNDMNEHSYIPPNSTGHDEAISLAGSWLKTCLTSHEKCKIEKGPPFMPPRLLDLQSDGIKLVDTSTLRYPLHYITLSYCWGSEANNLRLCSDNKQEMEECIHLDALPKTFRDAVHTSRHLGYNYLWIDALCIVQEGCGSKEDWREHVKIMGRIYQYATLNLSADASSTAREGLFRDRNRNQLVTPRGVITQGRFKGNYVIHSNYGYEYEPPLNLRGWHLQERLLSSRVLHFGREQLEWECGESSTISERYPFALNESTVQSGTHWSKAFNMMQEGHSTALTNFLEHIMDYTNRKLTYPISDKFAGFSAIAEHFSKTLEQPCYAGFLKNSLPFALLWNMDREEDSIELTYESPSTVFRAPSWSWASSDTPVSFYNFNHFDKMIIGGYKCISLAEIKSLQVLPSDPSNVFGQLDHATLTLNAPTSPCSWNKPCGSRYLDELNTPDFPIPNDKTLVRTTVEFDNTMYASLPFDEVRAVAIYTQFHEQWNATLLYVLLLRQTSTEYRRVGVGRLEWPYEKSNEARLLGLSKEKLSMI
ncbi:unnamed protein product [Periconia digitata]|uniref:Heterokaryon incompatibility domain-containing protein n=1 Tax=Periconia digitata TaxID=1303443 RepID=A0A9W4UCH0_9PLEO|nr:unnamed protein product [Periconia digitata]